MHFQLSFLPVCVTNNKGKVSKRILALEEVGAEIVCWNDHRQVEGRSPLYGSLEFYHKGLIRPQGKAVRFQNDHARILYAGTGPSSNGGLREALKDLSNHLLENLGLPAPPIILLPAADFQN